MSITRKAVVTSVSTLAQVQAYLPSNYRAGFVGKQIIIRGKDVAGWTLDGYVIPRLASGMVYVHEVTEFVPPSVFVRLVIVAEVDPETNEVIGYESNDRNSTEDEVSIWDDKAQEWTTSFDDEADDAVLVAQHYLHQTLNVKVN